LVSKFILLYGFGRKVLKTRSENVIATSYYQCTALCNLCM